MLIRLRYHRNALVWPISTIQGVGWCDLILVELIDLFDEIDVAPDRQVVGLKRKEKLMISKATIVSMLPP